MPTTYTVTAGESLSRIAAKYGTTWQAIYNDPANAAFRAKRPNPNQIFPGDVLVIPDNDKDRDKDKSAARSEPPPPSVDDAAMMALDVYDATTTGQGAASNGWSREAAEEGPMGFAAATYRRGRHRVISYCGTNDAKDGLVDASMVPAVGSKTAFVVMQTVLERYGLSRKSKTSFSASILLAAVFGAPPVQIIIRTLANRTPASQTDTALKFFDKYKDASLVVGHSLGGALAQVVSMKRNVPAVAFNSPFMGDLRGTTPTTSTLILCVNTEGDPLSLATRTAGNRAHGRVITLSIPPYPDGPIPVRQPIAKRSWEAILEMVFVDAVQGAKAGYGIARETTQYARDLVRHLGKSAGYYHSMKNLADAVSKQTDMRKPIQPGFAEL